MCLAPEECPCRYQGQYYDPGRVVRIDCNKWWVGGWGVCWSLGVCGVGGWCVGGWGVCWSLGVCGVGGGFAGSWGV